MPNNVTAPSDLSPIAKFAAFLRQDLDAVTAGLTLPWSSGVVEGHVNRIILWNQRCVHRRGPDRPRPEQPRLPGRGHSHG